MSQLLYTLDLWIIAAVVVVLIAGAVLVGGWLGPRLRKQEPSAADGGALSSALGLLGLLIAISFYVALAGYNTRRSMAVEEATALESAAENALLLPASQKEDVLPLLRQFAEARSRYGVPYDPARIPYDDGQSQSLLSQLWKQAAAADLARPQSAAVQSFAASLDHLSRVYGTRAAELHNDVPASVIAFLVCASTVGMGLAGFRAGRVGDARTTAGVVLALTFAFAIVLTIDLDKPGRGSYQAQREPLESALRRVTALAAAPPATRLEANAGGLATPPRGAPDWAAAGTRARRP